MDWTPKTVAVWQEWRAGPYLAFKRSFDGDWHLRNGNGDVVFSWPALQEVMAHAEVLEATRVKED